MSDVKVCRICLQTGTRMYNYAYQLKLYYEEILAFKVDDNEGLPPYLCYECTAQLRKYHKFREKCFTGKKILKDILHRGLITYEAINNIDRNEAMLITHLTTNTLVIDLDNSEFTEVIDEQEQVLPKAEPVEVCYLNDNSLSDIESIGDLIDEESAFDGDTKNNISNNKEDIKENVTDGVTVNVKDKQLKSKDDSKNNSTSQNKKKKSITKKKSVKKPKNAPNKHVRDTQSGNIKLSRKALSLDENHWKTTILTEEEAAESFKARAQDPKFIAAPFKCQHCLKWFQKKDIFDRHVQLRHVQSLGEQVCHFCQYRFKHPCQVTKHISQHYTRFKCLRCSLECPLEQTAILHEEWHSGVTKKCTYCDEEFRHSSTYYTHLRTHRSVHVCTLCGASFVSKVGLNMHKHLKHVIVEIESPDDDEDVNTYCKRCDIRFETRKAYQEHLFHSALHSDVESPVNSKDVEEEDEKSESNDKVSPLRKLLSKKQQVKYANNFKKRYGDEIHFNIKAGKRRRNDRKHRSIPTTCHQCGEHFATQAACMKHHRKAHPRTCFQPPSERYICEVCGASLAPGSISLHMNIHSGEKMYKCDTCGKEFTASISLKRHILTHTGEKPFPCPLCDKRFTQSNSMKLHYNTFHLKQPYPKRNRRKKTEEPKEVVQAQESNTEDSSDESVSDVAPRKKIAFEAVMEVLPARTDDDMQYFTLS